MTANDGLEDELLNPPQISVVDDDQQFRESMSRLLKSLDYLVFAFSSAADFLASPKLGATTCLVCDVRMPTMTGVELYKHLIGKGNLIPTILVTAYPNESERERMLALGVECYLGKPLVETIFVDCLRSSVARSMTTPKAP